MKDTKEILFKLRELLKQPFNGQSLAAYIIPSDDEHQSEYIAAHDGRRAFVSGFDGSAGTAVVTMDKALLWTDGRYYQQASKQLDSNWSLMKDGLPNTPSIGTWLAKSLPKGSSVGVDPKLMSFRVWKPIQKELNSVECKLVAMEKNLVDVVWGSAQPFRPHNPIISLGLEFTGATVAKKWNEIRDKMNESKASALVVSALDEIAWFLNLRGSDIEYNPVFFAYLIVTHNDLKLFVNESALPVNFKEHQAENQVSISIIPYDQIGCELSNIVSSSNLKIV